MAATASLGIDSVDDIEFNSVAGEALWDNPRGKQQTGASLLQERENVAGINDTIGLAGMNAWTCCKQHERDAIGCKSSNRHLQCMETLKTLREMNSGGDGNLLDILDEDIAAESGELVEGQAPVLNELPVLPTKTALSSSETDRVPEGFMVHHYSEGETLPGLAIRYLVTVQDIKRANGFSIDSVDPGRSQILIPKRRGQPAPTQQQPSNDPVSELVRRADAQEHPMSREDAIFYLDDHGGSVERALAAHIADRNWEQANPHANPDFNHLDGDEGESAGCCSCFQIRYKDKGSELVVLNPKPRA